MLWIGTYDGGLNRLEGGRLTRYSRKDGLYDDIVTQILPDSRGFFWISGGRHLPGEPGRTRCLCRGPDRVDHLHAVWTDRPRRPFEATGGFQPAGFRAHDGMLWFPTSDGLAVVNPTLVPVNETPPPMVIESCLVDRESVECRDGLRIEPRSGGCRDRVHRAELYQSRADAIPLQDSGPRS